ncbi:MAG: methionine gamma-lyase family protein [Acutalibacteraceae bacterium]|nr:methionine gamma-lyase family protein [Acutalibacteraceae bacterium]
MSNNFFNINEKLLSLDSQVLSEIKEQFEKIENITKYNQQKVLSAFINNRVSEAHLGISTGYGYDDIGRETLEKLWAECMGAEDSLIRHNFVSGTHTLTVALFGILRPNDKMLCLTGRPYDTLIGVLGIDKHSDGSLADFGVKYSQVDLNEQGMPDEEAIKEALKKDTYKMAYIQRSRGYSLRPSLSVNDIERLCKIVKENSPETIIMVDNCYGEFVEKKEPTQVGADIIAGSLIKNPGGGIAPTGGYIAGRRDLIEKCAYRLTAPGVGKEVGATLGHNRELYMGVFAAPHTVGEALKTAVYCSALFSKLGYKVTPSPFEDRADIIQSVILGNRENLIAFCKGMQSGAPVDSYVSPEPWAMPGYDDEVIMAAGSFTLGASIELSADAPLREPFAAWMQGGLNFHSGQMGVLLAAQSMLDKGLLTM